MNMKSMEPQALPIIKSWHTRSVVSVRQRRFLRRIELITADHGFGTMLALLQTVRERVNTSSLVAKDILIDHKPSRCPSVSPVLYRQMLFTPP